MRRTTCPPLGTPPWRPLFLAVVAIVLAGPGAVRGAGVQGASGGPAVISGRITGAHASTWASPPLLFADTSGLPLPGEGYLDGGFRFPALHRGRFSFVVPGAGPLGPLAVPDIDLGPGDRVDLTIKVDPGASEPASGTAERVELAQRFVARGRTLTAVAVRVAGRPVRLRASVVRGALPRGREVGPQRGSGRAAGDGGWAVIRWCHGEVPLVPGEVYTVRMRSSDGRPWRAGLGGRAGSVVPGVFFDGVEKPSRPLDLCIDEDTGEEATDYAAEAGYRRIRAVSCDLMFKPVSDRIRLVCLPVGVADGAGEGRPLYLRASVHRGGSEDVSLGPQIGPARRFPARGWGDRRAVFAWSSDEVPVHPGKIHTLHVEREGGATFLVFANDRGDDVPGAQLVVDGVPLAGTDLAALVRGRLPAGDAAAARPRGPAPEQGGPRHPASVPQVPRLPMVIMTRPGPRDEPAGVGSIAGTAGGSEVECVVFGRARGAIHRVESAPDGRYRFDRIPPGEYVVFSSGTIAPVVVRAGRTTSVDFSGDAGSAPQAETWSPERAAFAETFIARREEIRRVALWNPGKPVRLAITIREGGPEGPVVGHPFVFDGPRSWLVEAWWPRGAMPTTPGRRYYLEALGVGRVPWSIGTGGVGDGGPGAQAYYDGEPQLDTDIAFAVGTDPPGLVTVAEVREEPGLPRRYPVSSSVRTAGQTFVATASNIIGVYVKAGWKGKPVDPVDFYLSLHEFGPDGRRLGRMVHVPMVRDRGGTAVWLPGEVETVVGRTYFLRLARTDGEPFHVHMAENPYRDGTAHRDGIPMERFDLIFTARGEVKPGSVTYPFNVQVSRRTSSAAVVEWEAAGNGRSLVRYGEALPLRNVARSGSERGPQHRAVLEDLRAATPYLFQVVCEAAVPGSGETCSTLYDLLSLPASPDRPRYLGGRGGPAAGPNPDHPRPGALANPGFEDGLSGWRSFGSIGEVTAGVDGLKPRSGRSAFGYYHVVDIDREAVPRRLEPAERSLVAQEVRVEAGADYIFSGWVLTGERGGAWQRNNRVRLVYDPGGGYEGMDPTARDRESHATQWYATEGTWRRFRVLFRAEKPVATVGFEFYRWWALETDYLFVDDASIEKADRTRALPAPGRR